MRCKICQCQTKRLHGLSGPQFIIKGPTTAAAEAISPEQPLTLSFARHFVHWSEIRDRVGPLRKCLEVEVRLLLLEWRQRFAFVGLVKYVPKVILKNFH